MKKHCLLMVLLAAVLSMSIPTGFVEGQEAEYNVPYTWDTVSYGGGGYVTGIVFHPKEENLIYIRTDVGGTYRWDQENNRWWALNEAFSAWERNLYGCDGIAIDPNNPDVVYMCAGKYLPETAIAWGTYNEENAAFPYPCDVLKSTDRGETWESTGFNKPFNGNGNHRDTGEPIMVDPQNSNYIYVASRDNRIYRSSDGAATWEELNSFPYINANDLEEAQYGEEYPTGTVRTVLIDENSEKDGVCQTIYVGAIDVGVYVTHDAGETWELMKDSPEKPKRMALADDGRILYVSADGGVYKYTAGGSWENITPGQPTQYTGMAVDPTDDNTIYCVRVTDPDSGSVYRGHVFQSKDGGKTWTDKYETSDIHFTTDWYPDQNFAAATACLAVNPFKPEQVWLTDWYGVWKTNDINQEPRQFWINDIRGIEEMVAFTAICPSKGARLLTGNADNDGARWADSILEYPDSISNGIWAQDTNGLDWCEQDPNLIVRASGNREWGGGKWGYSVDNGVSWREFPSFPQDSNGLTKLSGIIAVSSGRDANGTASIVAVPMNSAVYYSKDMGTTWLESVGLPSNMITSVWSWKYNLCSDRNNKDIFYCYEGGNFYVSTDGGASFINTVSDLPSDGTPNIESAPGMNGVVWVSLNGSGLYGTNDFGQTFSKIEGVEYARLFSFGKNAPGKNNPTAYVYGNVNGVEGIFRSVDMGKTWVRINTDEHKVGNEPNCMRADRQTFGMVYIGTNGRGYYYGKPENENELLDVEKNAQAVASGGTVDLADLEKDKIKVYVNEERIHFEVEPNIIDGTTYVPLRRLLEALGFTVEWNGANGYAVAAKDEDTLYIMPGSSAVIKNNEPVDIGKAAYLEADYTMIPLRAISELYQAQVVWDGSTKSIYITTTDGSQAAEVEEQ